MILMRILGNCGSDAERKRGEQEPIAITISIPIPIPKSLHSSRPFRVGIGIAIGSCLHYRDWLVGPRRGGKRLAGGKHEARSPRLRADCGTQLTLWVVDAPTND